MTNFNMTLLNGHLEIYIDRAEDLMNTDTSCFGRHTSDPYVTGRLGNTKILRTDVISNSVNPEWKVGMNHPRVGELQARSLGIMFFW